MLEQLCADTLVIGSRGIHAQQAMEQSRPWVLLAAEVVQVTHIGITSTVTVWHPYFKVDSRESRVHTEGKIEYSTHI